VTTEGSGFWQNRGGGGNIAGTHHYPCEYCSSDVPTFVRPSDGKARIGISNEYMNNVVQCTVAGLYSSH
jgi:hypothetical protein